VSGEFRLDFPRRERVGLDEAVLSAGKTPAQLDAILEAVAQRGERVLLTRLGAEQLAALDHKWRSSLDYDPLSRTAVHGGFSVPTGSPRVAVVTAGTSDLYASREAVRTLHYHGQPTLEVNDVGVAGLWRLLERVEELRRMAVVIVAAGMDGALPSVIGGLVPGAVIALPTAVGHGVADGGRTALHAALASCAPGLAVVNIDNGYGAACAALRILSANGGGAR